MSGPFFQYKYLGEEKKREKNEYLANSEVNSSTAERETEAKAEQKCSSSLEVLY